ncbi:RidA family protein [Amycolatopsis cihanbeyliensis]|uniref:Enamine deaminase RidA (YjgF/YER057c/UK114 family) n=1 Tax=Amycolatopsis cihanbeyliensis TaxID=1128664 RepID=A0A542CUF4_AMYCI|nr:RidA family protein [Amycolatopsis cihanbeyliensis]TQI94448.1 enamine deaminase RidA (YjgF/YER057c/UK114 family) [Amycolatopsis cihanbeyliensis]
MDGEVTPHRVVTAAELAKPVGYAHAVVAAPGRTVYLGGQTAQDMNGEISGSTISEQFDIAAGNVVIALRAAGGGPQHLVSLIVYVTDVPAYRAALRDLGPLYRKHFGRHYPAVALLGVAELFDPDAKLELVGTAVIT